MSRLALALLLVAGRAYAGDPVPHATAVTGKLDGNVAQLAARFTLVVTGPQVAYQLTGIALPAQAAITGGEIVVAGKHHRLELRDAEAAAAGFEAVVARPGTRDRGWAVTLAHHDDLAVLGIALPRTATVEVALELAVPTCFFADTRYVAIPADWVGVLDRALRPKLAAAAIAAQCPTSFADPHWVGLPASEAAKQPPGEPRIAATAGRVAVGTTHLARVELDLAAAVSDVPADLATVLVIDGSRSLTPAQLDAQRELVLGYLRAVPHSRVQVIAYARTARALLPAWTEAEQAAPKLERALRSLAPRNGSNVDDGLELAGTWLGRTTGTRRTIVVTDQLLAERLDIRDATTLRRLLPDGTLAHVVALDRGGDATIVRDESIKLAALAIATDGLAARAGAASGKLDATLLARPTSLDMIEVHAQGWTIEPLTAGSCTAKVESLAEGTACTWWGKGAPIAGPITVQGLLWGRRITRLVTPDPARGEQLARELLDRTAVETALQDQLAVLAHAVDSKFTLFATWGGGDGYGDVGGSGMGFSGTSSFSDDAIDSMLPRPPVVAAERPLDLTAQVKAALAPCKPPPVFYVDIETTQQEIVGLVLNDPTISAPVMHACIENALWDLALVIPNAPDHATTMVQLK